MKEEILRTAVLIHIRFHVSHGCQRSIQLFLTERIKPPQGGGEPAIIAIGAVVANAIYDATGARLYRMPMTPDKSA